MQLLNRRGQTPCPPRLDEPFVVRLIDGSIVEGAARKKNQAQRNGPFPSEQQRRAIGSQGMPLPECLSVTASCASVPLPVQQMASRDSHRETVVRGAITGLGQKRPVKAQPFQRQMQAE